MPSKLCKLGTDVNYMCRSLVSLKKKSIDKIISDFKNE